MEFSRLHLHKSVHTGGPPILCKLSHAATSSELCATMLPAHAALDHSVRREATRISSPFEFSIYPFMRRSSTTPQANANGSLKCLNKYRPSVGAIHGPMKFFLQNDWEIAPPVSSTLVVLSYGYPSFKTYPAYHAETDNDVSMIARETKFFPSSSTHAEYVLL
ncbi:hypothetical protein EI94DRAFT_1312067 [Lactarius quietus]|nr:hypothetical protein EI94DRAFT_1312067 [Lactarius quietus]